MDRLGTKVSGMSLFCSVENTEINRYPTNTNARLPLRRFFVPANTSKSAFISLVFLLVVSILLLGYYTQVAQSIVRTMTVYVINLPIWKFTMNHGPNKSMRFVHLSEVANLNVSVSVKTCYRITIAAANQYASFLAIRERLTQFFKIKIVHSIS